MPKVCPLIDVIKAVEDNHEDNGIRLGDVLHCICHKIPNLTQEEVIKIIELKQPDDVTPVASLYSHCEECEMDGCCYKNLVDNGICISLAKTWKCILNLAPRVWPSK